ncbi:MAG TPA: ATPase, T2SS/T4P/T4SS family, partial [Gammaproteobacteria bacterium]|nr:ATPase, T2SS/T4P/T4SS family [Gammaproteobacteria bacterium]
MAATATQGPLSGLPRRLVQDGVVSEADLVASLEAIGGKSANLVPYLVANKLGDPRQIAIAAAHEFGVPLLDLDAVDLDLDVVKLVEEKLLTKHKILPLLQRGKRLYIAVCDPTNVQALDEVKFHTTLRIEPVVVEQNKLEARVTRAIEALDTTMQAFEEDDFDLENLEVSAGDEEVGGEITNADVDDAPIVRFVNKVMVDAIKRGASDIHFEPYEKHYRIRLRQDGELIEIARPPVALSMKVAARLKVMARLDIAERRIPQDGRFKARRNGREIDVRVSIMPSVLGEDAVLRILDKRALSDQLRGLTLERLGFDSAIASELRRLSAEPHGMLLVTGPTGSGKTTTLYSVISEANTGRDKIVTIEDPVEYQLPGVLQIPVNEKKGLTFA